MQETLKTRLAELGLATEQVAKLEAEGVTSEADIRLLSGADIKNIIGGGLVSAIKIRNAFEPVLVVPLPAPPAPATSPVDGNGHDDLAEPTPTKVTPDEVKTFASNIGMDANMLNMVLMGNMVASTGTEMDMSSMMPIPAIVGGYSPKRRDISFMVMSQIERRLGTAIVVINNDGSVNTDLTTKYVMSLEEGFPAPDDGVYTDDSGSPYQIVRVGVDAQSVYDSDPIVPGKALPKNNIGTGRVNWNSVSLEVRQVAYLAVTQTGEINPTNDSHLAWLRDHIKSGSNRLVFHGQAPRAITAYNEALRTGSLPTLRVMLTRTARRSEVMPRRRYTQPRDLAGIGRTGDDENGSSGRSELRQ